MANSIIFDRIFAECKLQEISINELEARCNLAKNSIYKWNSPDGANPKMDSLNKIARTLGISLDYLVGNVDIKEPIDVVMSSEGFNVLQRASKLTPEKQTALFRFFNECYELAK